MKRKLPFLFGLVLVTVLAVSSARADIASNVVISEIQVGDLADADNEFVELYNPTGGDLDLAEWKLKLGSGSNLVASMTGTIKSHGYFLVAKPQFTTIPVTPDMVYSASSSAITANSTVLLQMKTGDTFADVDKVGMGSGVDGVEGTAVPAPTPGQSIERKSADTGVDESGGNGWDTDNNLNDFVVRGTPQPQNSQSATEPPVTPTPTVSPTPEISPTVEPTVEPTAEPTPTDVPPTPTEVPPTPTEVQPTPTLEPTPEPTAEPTPTDVPPTPTDVLPSPTVEPSPTTEPSPTEVPPTPTLEPSPTIEPTPTETPPTPTTEPTPTLAPSPTIVPSPTDTPPPTQVFANSFFTCRITYTPKTLFRWLIWWPRVSCEKNTGF